MSQLFWKIVRLVEHEGSHALCGSLSAIAWASSVQEARIVQLFCLHDMPESVFCHGCSTTTTTEAQYSNAGDRVCPQCESDFIELVETPSADEQPQVAKFGFDLSNT